MTLRTVEEYVSYQGEGPNTTRPTLFVRFAGCNFKCPGWPCDTQHAIQPSQFKKLQTFWTAAKLADRILSFETPNVCLTGGEVFLQNKTELAECLELVKSTYPEWQIECFTNGGLAWDARLVGLIDTFIVDWKLPGSGEEYDPTPVLGDNLKILGDTDAIKFTIKDRRDYEEAKRRYKEHIQPLTDQPQIYAGVVWGAMQTEELCKWMLDDNLDWNLNVQVHKFVWDPNKQGV